MLYRSIVDSIEVVDVVIGSHTLKVRQLAGLEVEMLSRIRPQPTPPLVNDPNLGSLAPKIPNPDDPAYLAAVEAWSVEHVAAVAAVALGADELGIAERWPEVTVATHGQLATRQAAETFLAAGIPIVLKGPWSAATRIYDAALGRGVNNIEAAEKN